MALTKKEMLLIVEFLKQYSDDLSNNVCNDWNFPSDWTKEEQIQFVKEYHNYNGDPQEFNEKFLHVQDSSAVWVLSRKLEQQIKDWI